MSIYASSMHRWECVETEVYLRECVSECLSSETGASGFGRGVTARLRTSQRVWMHRRSWSSSALRFGDPVDVHNAAAFHVMHIMHVRTRRCERNGSVDAKERTRRRTSRRRGETKRRKP